MRKYLREKYKTMDGARKRARFENAMALSEFQNGHKARWYAYLAEMDSEGNWRVVRFIKGQQTTEAN